jgi:hypothetical protein
MTRGRHNDDRLIQLAQALHSFKLPSDARSKSDDIHYDEGGSKDKFFNDFLPGFIPQQDSWKQLLKIGAKRSVVAHAKERQFCAESMAQLRFELALAAQLNTHTKRLRSTGAFLKERFRVKIPEEKAERSTFIEIGGQDLSRFKTFPGMPKAAWRI